MTGLVRLCVWICGSKCVHMCVSVRQQLPAARPSCIRRGQKPETIKFQKDRLAQYTDNFYCRFRKIALHNIETTFSVVKSCYATSFTLYSFWVGVFVDTTVAT